MSKSKNKGNLMIWGKILDLPLISSGTGVYIGKDEKRNPVSVSVDVLTYKDFYQVNFDRVANFFYKNMFINGNQRDHNLAEDNAQEYFLNAYTKVFKHHEKIADVPPYVTKQSGVLPFNLALKYCLRNTLSDLKSRRETVEKLDVCLESQLPALSEDSEVTEYDLATYDENRETDISEVRVNIVFKALKAAFPDHLPFIDAFYAQLTGLNEEEAAAIGGFTRPTYSRYKANMKRLLLPVVETYYRDVFDLM